MSSTSAGAGPRKLNLGCGFDIRDGYLNVDVNDFHKPDLVCDITNLLKLPSEYFDEVVAQDVLEHIPRAKTEAPLAERQRVTAPGGQLRLRVPNLLGLFNLFTQSDRQSREAQRILVQCAYGTQAYEGDFHLTGFTPRLLVGQLVAAGFTNIKIATKDEWLMDVTAFKKSGRTVPLDTLLSNDDVCAVGWHRVEDHHGKMLRWSSGRSVSPASRRIMAI